MNEYDDEGSLVAYADGKLDEAAARQLEARIAVDPALRDRLTLIQNGGLPFASAFQTLLAAAPVARMEEALSALLAAHPLPAPGKNSPSPWRPAARMAAAVALVVFGIGLGRLAPFWPTSSPQPVASSDKVPEDWRDAVAEYASLYTADTFATRPRDASAEAKDLEQLGAKLGVALTPDRVAISDGEFRGAQILSYGGAPLGQIAYADPTGLPILFCIMADNEPDAAIKVEPRGEYSSASWARAGRSYMVIARAPQDQVAHLAAELIPRF